MMISLQPVLRKLPLDLNIFNMDFIEVLLRDKDS